VGAVQFGDVAKVFQWPRADVERTIRALVDTGTLVTGLSIPGQKGDWFALVDL
jgi:hypothetical protein